MAFTQITVTGTYQDGDNNPLPVGNVKFLPTSQMRNDTNPSEINSQNPVRGRIVNGVLHDAAGTGTLTLAATDDAGTTPAGVLWRVEERLGQNTPTVYYIAVPSAGGSISLNTVPRINPTDAGGAVLTQVTRIRQALDYNDGTAPTNGQAIVWDSTGGKFKPGTVAGGSYTDEQAQDATAALFASGTHTGVSFAYDDAGNALSATVSASADLPEATTTPRTSAATASSLLGKTTRYDTSGGAINQTLPAAVAGAVFAVGWDAGTAALTLTAAGSDVIGTGSATSVVLTLSGELRTYHCTTTGRWRVSGGNTPASAIPLNSANTDLTGASVGRPVAVGHVTGGAADGFVVGSAVIPVLAEQAKATTATPTVSVRQLLPVGTDSNVVAVQLPAIPATGDPIFVGTRWETGANAASVAAVGGDVVGVASATAATIPLLGETVIWQGTPGGTVGTGRWRALTGLKPQSALNAKSANYALLASYIGV